MKLGFSLLSSERLLAGLQIKKTIEPSETNEQVLAFQPIVIITIGFVFGYIDLVFNNGKVISMGDAIDEFNFEKIGPFNDENETESK